jgi:hypothetical protein
LCQINIYRCVVRSDRDHKGVDEDGVEPGILLWAVCRITIRGFRGSIIDTVLDQVLGATRRLFPPNVNTNTL